MRQKGFTILELLVVVAIIGLIAAISLAMFSDTRARSRDAKRLADMREIEKALNLYYSSVSQFPISASEIVLSGSDAVSVALEEGGYISYIPGDPLPSAHSYWYQSDANGTEFTLRFCLETDTIQGYASDCTNTIRP